MERTIETPKQRKEENAVENNNNNNNNNDQSTTNTNPQYSHEMNRNLPISGTSCKTHEDIWLQVEDDIIICMQNATTDENFVYTIHWLNNAKGITRTIPRTAEEARARYQFLCTSGTKDARLQDRNVKRTILKLTKSMKRPSNGSNTIVSMTAATTPIGRIGVWDSDI